VFGKLIRKKDPSGELIALLQDTLEKMEAKQIDRLTFYFLATEAPHPSLKPGFATMNQNQYYPREVLDPVERKFVEEDRHYSVISLVRKNVFGLLDYPSSGVEVVFRARFHPMLPSLKNPVDDINFTTLRSFNYLDSKEFMEFVQAAQNMLDLKQIQANIKERLK